LWSETIETHRGAVRGATLDAAAALVAEHGLASVTMSQIAKTAGIGRATLYKYFPDVESILIAWHERQIADHLHHLTAIRDQTRDPGQQLQAVLEAYARMRHEHHGTELAALLHRGDHFTRAEQHLNAFIADIITAGTTTGHVRDDIAADELASYCLHALAAANTLTSKAAIRRLVLVTMSGLRPGA
jgi:AcrR family transcriptional regulator